ncbi:polysaccharide pyruvyl transferase family protein [Methanosarcina sp.]|uniref:polysaccharide pyruvyl transferase family protein n=1 Tax=Methanosarcina sp. TaxID=2213 RepID=UPI003BB501E0
MTKILIVNFGGRFNKGGVALVNSMIETIKYFIPNCKFTALAHQANYNQYPIKVIETVGSNSSLKAGLKALYLVVTSLLLMVFNRFGIRLNPRNEILREYVESDAVINTGGDNLTEDYGTLSLAFNLSYLLIGLIFKKPVVIYAESIGPFRGRISRLMANFVLNRVNLITIREEISKKNLNLINVNKPRICLTADSAFLLKAVTAKRLTELLNTENITENDRPLVGISISKIISRYGFADIEKPEEKYQQYVSVMAKTIEYITDNLEATVVIVPHVIDPRKNDDRWVADDVCKLISNKSKVISIKEDYTPEELKGIIGHCDLFIGARMHATIASTSMLVPTIGIAYSHKIYGIVGEMLGQKEYILDVKELTYESLISKIDDVWKNRETIKEQLGIKVPQVKERAMLNGKLVKELLSA